MAVLMERMGHRGAKVDRISLTPLSLRDWQLVRVGRSKETGILRRSISWGLVAGESVGEVSLG